MPRNYKRTSTRQSWDAENMKAAIEEVVSGNMGYKRAAENYHVPQTTLERRVRRARDGGTVEEASEKGLGRFKTVFSAEQEKELADFIISMVAQLFGLTLTELRKLAYELADRNNMAHQFNTERQMAGKQWLYSFLARNPTIRLRTPEATSLARAIGFNKISVNAFFDLLTNLYEKHNFTPEKIWNVDETGITTVPKKQSRVLGLKGKRQVGGLVSAERGTLVTTEICMRAAGNFMPPMFIFPRVRAKPELMDEAPPGSFAEFHPSGWIQKEIFLRWFRKFVEFTNPTKEHPVLLLLDGHASHTKNLNLIDYARAHHVVLLCFPPHTTHRMQPLDVAFMGPLSSYYSQEVKTWLRLHPGRAVSIYQVGKLFGAAYQKAASVQNAVSGFQKTGIYPLNRDTFDDWMFAPSKTTDNTIHVTADTSINLDQSDINLTISIEPENNDEANNNTPEFEKNSETLDISTAAFTRDEPRNVSVGENPGTSGIPKTQSNVSMGENSRTSNIENIEPNVSIVKNPETSGCQKTSRNPNISAKNGNKNVSSFRLTPKMLMPIPQATRKPVTRNVRRGKTVVLTESPYKKELEQSFSNKGKNLAKRKYVCDTENISKQKTNKKAAIKPSKAKKVGVCRDIVFSSSEEYDDSSSDTSCLYCNDLFSNSKSEEGWVQCNSCKNWSHEACAGIEPGDCEPFTCDHCVE